MKLIIYLLNCNLLLLHNSKIKTGLDFNKLLKLDFILNFENVSFYFVMKPSDNISLHIRLLILFNISR